MKKLINDIIQKIDNQKPNKYYNYAKHILIKTSSDISGDVQEQLDKNVEQMTIQRTNLQKQKDNLKDMTTEGDIDPKELSIANSIK